MGNQPNAFSPLKITGLVNNYQDNGSGAAIKVILQGGPSAQVKSSAFAGRNTPVAEYAGFLFFREQIGTTPMFNLKRAPVLSPELSETRGSSASWIDFVSIPLGNTSQGL